MIALQPDSDYPSPMQMRRHLWAAAVFQCLGLAVLGWYFQKALNPDAVAYLRLAEYYSKGQLELAISGYWGPLLSWLMVPGIKLGMPSWVAGRCVMGLSAMLFFWGSLALFRSLGLSKNGIIAGTWLVAATSLYWSVQYIIPDLLMSGLACFALSRMVDPAWEYKKTQAVQSGVIWGLAYLAKAVALPLAVVIITTWGILKPTRRTIPFKTRLLTSALTLAACLLVAAPWITTISLKYQTLTLSTSGRIGHAIVGPPDIERYHPYARVFHQPEPGRITSWEDPSRMDYHPWSPFESRAYAIHQFNLVIDNLSTCLLLLCSLHPLWIAIPLILLLNHLRSKRMPPAVKDDFYSNQRLGWGLMLWVAVLILPYLPMWVKLQDQRYFYLAFPLLFAASVIALETATFEGGAFVRWCKGHGVGLTTFVMALPILAIPWLSGGQNKIAGEFGFDLAQRLQASGLSGSIAGSAALPGGRAGLYAAFYSRQPWMGDELNPSPARFKASGARLVMARRNSPLAAALDGDPDFRNLDLQLFTNAETAVSYPVKVWANLNPARLNRE